MFKLQQHGSLIVTDIFEFFFLVFLEHILGKRVSGAMKLKEYGIEFSGMHKVQYKFTTTENRVVNFPQCLWDK